MCLREVTLCGTFTTWRLPLIVTRQTAFHDVEALPGAARGFRTVVGQERWCFVGPVEAEIADLERNQWF